MQDNHEKFESPKEKNTFYSRSVALNLDVIWHIELCISTRTKQETEPHLTWYT